MSEAATDDTHANEHEQEQDQLDDLGFFRVIEDTDTQSNNDDDFSFAGITYDDEGIEIDLTKTNLIECAVHKLDKLGKIDAKLALEDATYAEYHKQVMTSP